MEGTVDMTSNTSNSSAAASAPDNHQREAEVSSSKKPRVTHQAGGSAQPMPQRPQLDAALTCPRCNSNNTKFCYYNNYNLNQPRHFCKACRCYWTQGGSLRLVPIGGCRRNKLAYGSSSSSAASSTAATSAEMDNTVTTRLMLTAATTSTMSMRSPTTGLLFPNDMLPPFTPMGSSGCISHSTDQDQQGFLPFEPLPLSDDPAPQLSPRGSDTGFLPLAPQSLSDDLASDDLALELELALGGSDTMPTLLDMLTGGSFDACGSSSSYDAGSAMNSGSNGMDMSFSPKMGVSAADPKLSKGMDDDLVWQSYINDDGGYVASPAAGMEQEEEDEVGDQQQEEINNTKNTDGAEG